MTDTGTPIGRRVFLGLIGAGAAGVLVGGKVSEWLSNIASPVVSKDATGLSSLLPLEGFRFYTVTDGFPHKAAADYRLTVKGLVDKPLTLTYDEIRAMPATRLTKDFQCVTGWRVRQTHWTGVLLSDLLDRAGVQSSARAVRFTSFDGVYTESLTLEQARRQDVIVAYDLEDKPLSSDHGGPVRLYVSPMYGYKSCKWLDGIEVGNRVVPGYWEGEGYDVDAWVGRSNGRDDPATSS
ncbi:MAG TPA: molybdopterin-dependent oxidoreductase [Acidimicrobiia bacterium]|nr:molybdopterin-dependent oxidoreductase [Acidimicrobiia bacterium]